MASEIDQTTRSTANLKRVHRIVSHGLVDSIVETLDIELQLNHVALVSSKSI